MKNFKHLAVLTALFFFNWQINFAQTQRVFDFETLCSQNCLIENGNIPNVETFYGRPKVVTSSCSGKKLRLNYLSYNNPYSGGITSGGDGVFLNFPFKAGRTYRIKYKIYQQNQSWGKALPIDLDWILMLDNNNLRTPGNINDSQYICWDPKYAVRWPSNSQFLKRLTTSYDEWAIREDVPVEEASNYCTNQKEFTFQASNDADRVFIKLDVGGWSIQPDIFDFGSAEVYLDDIQIDECAPNSDFLLTIIGTTFYYPNSNTNQNVFNFSVLPSDLTADSYTLQISPSIDEAGTNFENNSNTNKCAYTFTTSNINTFPIDTRDRTDGIDQILGFRNCEQGFPSCLYYKITLTTTKCGISSCTSRIVKSCYTQNILNNSSGRSYNFFNYTIADQGLGSNRIKIIRCTSSSPSTQNMVNLWSFGSDNYQSGSFSDTQNQGSFNNLIYEKSYTLSNPKFYRITNEYFTTDYTTQSTKDQLIIYDRLELCGSTSSPNQQVSNVQSSVNLMKSSNNNELNVYPNPLTDQSTIQYNLSKADRISIYLTDISGKVVKQLVTNKEHEAGVYEILMSKENTSSGMYFIVMDGTLGKNVKKLIVD